MPPILRIEIVSRPLCGSFDFWLMNTVTQKMDHRLLRKVVKYDEIQANEDLVFKRLMEWFHNDEDTCKPHKPELLKLIRLELITTGVRFTPKSVSIAFILQCQLSTFLLAGIVCLTCSFSTVFLKCIVTHISRFGFSI